MSDAEVPPEMSAKLVSVIQERIQEKLDGFITAVTGLKNEHDAWKGRGSVGAETREMGVMLPTLYVGAVSLQIAQMLTNDEPAPPGYPERLAEEIKGGMQDAVEVLNVAVLSGSDPEIAKTAFIQAASEVVGRMLLSVATP